MKPVFGFWRIANLLWDILQTFSCSVCLLNGDENTVVSKVNSFNICNKLMVLYNSAQEEKECILILVDPSED